MPTLSEFKKTSIDVDKYYEDLEKNRNDVSDIEPPSAGNDFTLSNERMADNLLRQSQVDGTDPEMFAPGTEYGSNLGDLRKTRAYELYAYTDEQKLSQAQKMGKDLNLDPSLILYDDETYSKTIDMWNIGRGARSLADEGEPFDLEKVYEKHPALKAVAEQDMYAGAEALHNIKATEKLESLADIIKFTQEMNALTLRSQELFEKYKVNEGRNAEIDKEYEAIQAEREKLAKLLPDYGDDIRTRIMAESALQLPMLYRVGKRAVEGAARGAAVGGIAGATMGGVGAAPGAMTGAVWGARAGMFTGSYEEMLPEEALKLAYDGNNRSFDNVMWTARGSAGVQAGIESLSVGRFLKVVGGGKVASKGAIEAIKGAGEATFGMTAKQAAKRLTYGTVKETFEESLEEAAQDFVSNTAAWISAPSGAKTMTVGEMMASAGENFVQALAPSFGLGLVPGVMSTIPAVRKGAQVAAERGKVNMGVTINSRFSDYVNTALQDKNIMEFFHKSPEAAAAIAGKTLEDYGVKSVSLDVAGIMEQENGKEIMEAIAHENKMTAEQLEAAISGGDNMQVDVQTFMQVAAKFEGQNITDFANVAGKDAPNLYRAKQVQEAIKNIQNFNADKTEEALRTHAEAFYDNYVVEGIEDEQEKIIGRKLVNEIASTNPDDFKAGIETVLNGLDADSNERKVLENAVPKLRELAEDYALTQGLSKEGIAVYRNMVDTLQNGSRKVQQSAKASAILVARRAEMFARAMQEMGNKYTALDYMKRFEVNANAEGKIGDYAEVEYIKNNLYTQSITGNEFGSYKDGKELRKKADDFYRKNLQGTTAYNAAIGEIRLGKGLNRNEMRFSARGRNKMLSTGAKESKMLVVKYLKEIIENSNFVTEKEAQSEKHSRENFYYLYSKLSIGENDTRYVVVSIKEDQNKILTYYNHNVYTVEEYKKIEDTFAPHDASPTMSGQDAEVSSFTNSIAGKPIKGKQNVVYKQTAYHGSPYLFDKFDLGAIGTGEGNQLWGWGLYFAKDRKTSESFYKTLKEKEIFYEYLDSKKGTLDALKGETDVSFAVLEFEQDLRNGKQLIDAKKNALNKLNKQRDELDKQLTELEEEGVQSSDYYYRGLEDEYNDLQGEINVLNNVKKAMVGTGSPTIFEVSIPNNDVLLNLQERLDRQPPKVREGIQKMLENFPPYLKYYVINGAFERSGKEVGNAINKSTISGKRLQKLIADGIGEFLDFGYNNVETSRNDFVKWLSREFKTSKFSDYELSRLFTSPQAITSMLLNKYGIKGNTYVGNRDGRCFVVFDDKAINIIETYNQAQNFRARGSTSFMPDGKALINLFTRATKDTAPADQSTLPHEFGHMFLRDLQELAEMPNAPESIVKDWATVKDFLHVEDGKPLTRKQHEQFARHFEAYLMNGEAPTKSMQSVFRNFKKWLTDIYNDVKTLLSIEGGATQLNPDMKAVFDRMLASETEIEAAATNHEMVMENLANIVGSDASVQLVREWMNDAKAAAKESLLAGLMKDLEFWKGKNHADIKAAARATAEQTMRENAWYKASILADELKIDVVDARNQLGITVDEMKEATEHLRKNGYDLNNINDAVKKEAVRVEAMGKGILKTDEEIRQMAEENLNEHLEEVAVLEEMLFNEHMNDYRKAQGLIVDDINEQVKELKGDPKQDKFQAKIEKLKERNQQRIEKLKEKQAAKVKDLKGDFENAEANIKYEERYLAAERAMLDEIQKAKDAKHVDEIVQKYKEKVYQERWRTAEANHKADVQKGINEQHKELVRQYRDAVRGQSEQIRNAADEILAEHRIGEAMDFKMWQRLAEADLRNSIQLMSKAITMAGKDFAQSNELMQQAANARRRYAVHLRMANQSQKLNRQLLKKSDRMKKRTATMQKGKNVSARCRYVENNMLYLFGFTGKQDTNVPVDANVDVLNWTEFKQAFGGTGYGGDVDVNWRLISALKNNERLMWSDMTLGEYQDALDMLDFVYNLGKIEKGTHNMQYADSNGKVLTLEETIESIAEDFDALVIPKGVHGLENAKENLIKKYAAEYHAELVKPDIVLRALGQKVYDAVYTPFKRATDKEANMREQMQKELNEYGKFIPDKEKFVGEYVAIIGGQRVTREKIVMMALNYGTEKNAQRLTAGHGLNEMQIMEAFSNLTSNDVKFVNAVWGMYDKYWHDSAAMEERLSGFAPKKEQATAFDVTLKNGETVHFNGGYFPIKYNYDSSIPSQRAKVQNQKDASDALLARRFGMAAGSRYQSHTKSRVNQMAPGRELMLDISVIEQSQNDIIHDICFREVALDADRILTDERIAAGIQDKVGKECYDMLRKWAKDNYALQSNQQSAFSKAMSVLRRNTVAATLSLKVGWSLLNIGNFFLIGRRIGYANTAKMLFDYARKSDTEVEQYANHVNEWSPYMRGLEDTIEQNLRDVLDKSRQSNMSTRKWYDKSAEVFAKVGYKLPTLIDRLTVKPYWLNTYKAKYNECLEKGMDAKNAHDIAVDAGDEAVRNIVGSMRDIDLAGVQRSKNEIVKTLTMFYGYFSVVYNTFARDYYGNKGNPKAMFAALLESYIATCIADAMLAASWDTAKGVATGDDEIKKEGALEFWLKQVGFGSLGNAVSTIPLLRDAYRMGEYAVKTGRVQATALPQFRGVANVYDAGTKLSKGKYIDGAASAAEGVLTLTGLPYNFVSPFANFAHAMDGDYTYMEALLASFMDKRLKEPRKKKTEKLK